MVIGGKKSHLFTATAAKAPPATVAPSSFLDFCVFLWDVCKPAVPQLSLRSSSSTFRSSPSPFHFFFFTFTINFLLDASAVAIVSQLPSTSLTITSPIAADINKK